MVRDRISGDCFVVPPRNDVRPGSRKKKEDLIHAMNPHWNDLWEEISKW